MLTVPAGKKSLFEAEDTISLIVTLTKVPDKRRVRAVQLYTFYHLLFCFLF